MSAKTTAVKDVAAEDVVRKNLNKVRDTLMRAVDLQKAATSALRTGILEVRPSGLLSVDEMAEAVDRDRNYVDSVWSTHGETVKGKQTRVPVDADGEVARQAYNRLTLLADEQRRTASAESTARAERDRAVVMAYNARILGPSAIAKEVGIDRNHVLRIARRNGIGPQHRTGSRNQYTSAK